MKFSISSVVIPLAIITSLMYQTQCDLVVLPDVFYYNLTTTSRTDVYVIQNQRQYAAALKEMEKDLGEFHLNFHNRVDTIGLHSEFLEMKHNEMENKLNPLEILDDVSDYCVKKYRSKLPKIVDVKTNMKACLLKSTNTYNTIIAAADATFKNLKAHQTGRLEPALKDCKTKNKPSDPKYTTCITTAIDSTTTTVNSNMNTFVNQLKIAACTATTKIKESFDCAAGLSYEASRKMGEVWGLIENCIAGHEFCPSCGDADATTKGRCPYQLSWHMSVEDLVSEKITNPFKGLDKTTPCLQINFVTKSVALN